MIYEYKCPTCERIKDRIQCLYDYEHDQDIPDCCGKPMPRLIGACEIKVFDSYYNVALGREINTHGDIKKAKAEYKSRNGTELIEIGNEKVVAAPKQRVTINEAEKKDMIQQLEAAENK